MHEEKHERCWDDGTSAAPLPAAADLGNTNSSSHDPKRKERCVFWCARVQKRHVVLLKHHQSTINLRKARTCECRETRRSTAQRESA